MFKYTTFYKVTNLKVHSKGRYIFLNPFSRTTANGSFECQSVFLYLWHHKLYIPPTEIRLVGRLGEHLIEHCTFQNQNPVRVFLYHCIFDGNQLFSENVGCHFHFILHVMSEKAVFVSGALLCVQRYRGNLQLSRWQRINLHIYAATNSVSLGNYGINKFNCVTVSVQFML